MKANKILFPTDFSTCSDAGLKYATSLARDTGATLVIVHVEEPPMAYGGGEMYYGMTEPDYAALQKMQYDKCHKGRQRKRLTAGSSQPPRLDQFRFA